MKAIISLFALVIALSIQGATVVWDCFNQSQYDMGGPDNVFQLIDSDEQKMPYYIFPSVSVQTSKSGNDVTILGMIGIYTLAFQGLWLEKSAGDFIGHSTMTGQSDLFATTYGDKMYQTLTPIETTVGSTVYLAVMQGIDSENLTGKYYGWIELYVEKSGNVTLVHSAMDIDGDPIICGGGSAIPEPVSGLLMLVGAGVLALRRKRAT